MSPEAMFNFHNGILLLICGLFSLIVPFGWAQQRNNKPVEFNCPEEFGYYPHPTDCTQYYVCVFGGAILESCTGGLMYSHDLQTCDWPRNVGCGASSASASVGNVNTVSTASHELSNRFTTPSWKHEIPQPQHDEIPDRHLYEEEDLGPVEEIESDRQQRVYRGQPPTLGQVARDRDGIARHANALQTSAGPEKIKPVAVVSFGSHHQSLSKGNNDQMQSVDSQQNEHDILETNRVKRETSNSTSAEKRANGGYALRYRPAQVADSSSTESTVSITQSVTKNPNISYNIHSSSTNSHHSLSTGSMRLIRLPPTKSPVAAQTASQPYYATPAWSSRPFYSTTPRNLYHVNPSVSGSSRFNTYANSEQNLNDFTATDFSIVSVAPKLHTHQPFGSTYTTLPPAPMSYDYRDSNFHSTMHNQMPAATHHHAVHNFPNPHTFRRNYINSYYGSAGPPRFVPYPPLPPPPQYPYSYSQPETSIVTLSYPNSSPDLQKPSTMILNNQINEFTSRASSTTETPTTPIPTTTTAAPVTEKPKLATTPETNVTKSQEDNSQSRPNRHSKVRQKPTKDNVKSNTIIHPKDDFEAEDEEYEEEDKNANEEEPEEEENEAEDFETYNFEEENEPETNVTSKNTNPQTSSPKESNDKKTDQDDVNENEETELEYAFEEEDDADDAEAEKNEKEKGEDDEADEKGEEKEDDDHIVKPPSAFYKRFITDELDNPFAKPDFDMNSFLTDLAKPIKVPGEETKTVKKTRKSKNPANRLIDKENAESNLNRNISRKQDRIVRLQLYDEIPQAIIKRPRATKPGQAPNKQVVPLALVHTYKPANYSYPARYHLHMPSNYNTKTYDSFRHVNDKTYDYKPYNTGSLGNYYNYQYPRYENPQHQSANQTGNDYSEEACGDDGNPCNNEEEEEEEYANAEEEGEEEEQPAENDENANAQDNEEYYDDYANDYTSEHLKQPLSPPKVPSIPKRLKNIDKEVTSPPVNFDENAEENEEPAENEEENANNEEAPENEAPEEENEEYVDSNQQTADGEETVLSSQQYKTPEKHSAHYTGKGGNLFVDQIMIPHRENKLLKNPTTELSNHVPAITKPSSYKQKSTLNLPTSTTQITTEHQMSTYRTPIIRTTATYHAKVKQNSDYKDKIKPRTNKTRTSTEIKFQNPINPTLSYTTSNLVTNPAPPRKTEQRYGNKTKANFHKYTSEDEDVSKSNYKITDASRIRPTQKTTTAHWPPASVPTYIIEQNISPVPSTPKSAYNASKYEPYYNVYDDEAEVYRDIDYGQYNQRKQQDSYQVIQEPHRLQPVQPQSQPSQILTNSPSYRNQDYKLQSEIDGDTQQSEKLTSTRLYLDHNETSALSRHENNKPIEYFPFIRSAFSPVVDLTNNKQLKLTTSFQLGNLNVTPNTTVNRYQPNDLPYENIRSYELNFHNDDSIIGETSQLPAKVTSFTRKFLPLNVSSTTARVPKATTTSPRSLKPILRDNFRIIVEPISSKKTSLPPTVFTNKPTPSPENTIFTYKLPSTDKFSATYRSQAHVLSTTYTPYSIIQSQTTTSTAKPAVNLPLADNEKQNSNANNRRFYIPRTDLLERKLSFNPTTTNSPTIPRTESVKPTTKQINITPTTLHGDFQGRSFSSTTPVVVTESREGEENEILYYDDEYYDDGETPKNDDNYIDNKITEYPTSTNANDVPKQKNSTPPKVRLTKVPFSSTATNVPKSSFQIPNESSTNPSKVQAETKRPHRIKESYSERCPQCNEKPFGRGRNRGSITYTTGGNEYDAATPSSGRTRPTLKPSTSIVSKASEFIDIYKYPPKRPDNIYPTPQVDKAAAKCRKDICLLPDCSCGGKEIPGDLPVEETPQLVLLTFDDSVNELNRGLYTDLFEKGRTNPNGCPISATFYVSHEWTDYSMVQNLYAAGHEMASHSVSHSFGEQFSQRKWTKEIVGQREILSAYGGVRQEDIRGMRAPFLAVGGNKMFKMLYDANFTYDSSMPIYENRPPSWPYTLDYKIFHDCMIPPCPTRSYPGVWEVPMVMWQDLNGGRCSMGDACSNPSDADGVYKMLIKNFERHFTTNRAPFGLFYHSSWFTQAHHKEGFIAFLDTIVNMPEVWLVTNWQAIQWARDPTPISRLNSFTPFNCDYPERPRRCNNAKVCNLWHKSGVRYLKTCQPCPDVYPWTGKTGVRNSRVDNDDTLVE